MSHESQEGKAEMKEEVMLDEARRTFFIWYKAQRPDERAEEGSVQSVESLTQEGKTPAPARLPDFKGCS